MTTLAGRVIYRGAARGTALVSSAPLSFFGGFDLETGVVVEKGHPLEGQCVAGRILVFPRGTGSTVGSFALLRLARASLGPAALVMADCDTTVAVGAIIAEIPCVDRIELGAIAPNATVTVQGAEVTLERADP
jgi:predicted aconitase with swiveling domain